MRIGLWKVISRCSFTMFLFCLLTPAAYGGPKFADYPLRKVSECSIKTEKSGVVIGIQPVEDAGDQKNYFNSDLAKKGFVPVYIVIENESDTDSFLFDKSGVKVGVGTSMAGGPNTDSKGVQTLQVVSALTFSPVGLIVGLKLAKDEALVQANLVKKELQSKTLSPRASTSGFLYLPIPKVGPRLPIHLVIPIARSGDAEPFNLEMTF